MLVFSCPWTANGFCHTAINGLMFWSTALFGLMFLYPALSELMLMWTCSYIWAHVILCRGSSFGWNCTWRFVNCTTLDSITGSKSFKGLLRSLGQKYVPADLACVQWYDRNPIHPPHPPHPTPLLVLNDTKDIITLKNLRSYMRNCCDFLLKGKKKQTRQFGNV